MRGPPKGTLRKRGRVWWVRYAVRGERHAESLNTTDHEEARRLFAERMAQVRASAAGGVCPEERPAKVRIEDAWAAYLQSPSRPEGGEDTLRMYAYQFSAFVAWVKEAHPEAEFLGDVTEDIAKEFLCHVEKERRARPGTYNKHVDTLRRTFRYALGNGGKLPTPWDAVRRKKDRQARRRDFGVEEVRHLIGRATGWIRTLLVVGLYTGQRLGDCCRLRWEQVDFANGLIRVVPNKTRDSSRLQVELPMHPDLRACLEGLHRGAGSPRSGFVQPEVADRYERRAPEVSREIQEFIQSCGFEVHREGTGVDGVRAVVQYGFHSLRHTFVSICLRSEKVNREVIRSIVGDSYLLYNHVDNGSKRKAVELLPSISALRKGKPSPGGSGADLGGMSDAQLRRTLQALSDEMARREAAPKDGGRGD